MGIPGILAAATYYLQAISAGGLVTGLLLLLLLKFLAKGVELNLEAASRVSSTPLARNLSSSRSPVTNPPAEIACK